MAVGCGRIGYEPAQSIDAGPSEDAGIDVQLGPEVILDLGPGSKDNPASIWMSEKLVVGWSASKTDEVRVATLDVQGGVIDGPFSISGGLPADDCWLATDGNRIGAVWLEGDGPDTEGVYFRLLLATGEPAGPPVLLSAPGTNAKHPNIGWTGSSYVVVWEDATPSSMLRQMMVSADGITGDAIENFYPSGAKQSDIDLSNIDGTLHAVWRDAGQILRAEISSDGMLGAVEVAVDGTNSPRLPSISGDSVEHAVAYHDDPSGFDGVFVAFSGQATSNLDVEPAPAQGGEDVVIAKGGDVYALAWDGSQKAGVDGFTEYAIVSQSAGIIRRSQLSDMEHSASAHPTVVWTGEVFLAIWEYGIPGGDTLAFRRISL